MYEDLHVSSYPSSEARYYINSPGQSVFGVPSWDSYV